MTDSRSLRSPCWLRLVLILAALCGGGAAQAASTITATGATINVFADTPFTNVQVASFTDSRTTPSAPVTTDFTATITWGDSSSSPGVVVNGSGNFLVRGGHTYATTGGFTITVTITDTVNTNTAIPSGTAAVATPLAATNNGASLFGGLAVPAAQGLTTFTDTVSSAVNSDFTASISWGDSTAADTATSITGGGPFQVLSTSGHTYASYGKRTVTVTTSDNLGNTLVGSLFYNAGTTSATALATSPASPNYGDLVTLTATITGTDPLAGTPTGTVLFKDGVTTIGSGSLNGSGVASFGTRTLTAGASHSLTAAYQGDGSHQPSTSSAASVSINPNGSLTTLASSQNPQLAGVNVIFTATVTNGGSATPTGTVTFFDGTTTLGSGTALSGSGGTATSTFTTAALGLGMHAIRASYPTDGTVPASGTFTDLNQQITQVGGNPPSTSSNGGGCGNGIGAAFLGLMLVAALRGAGLRQRR